MSDTVGGEIDSFAGSTKVKVKLGHMTKTIVHHNIFQLSSFITNM